MIILDTNVLAEPLRPEPNMQVVKWLDTQAKSTLYTTVINLAEVKAGFAVMPMGARRSLLEQANQTLFASYFDKRILSFDSECADAYAQIYS